MPANQWKALAIDSNFQDSGVSVPRGSDDLICNTKECGGHPHLSVLLNGDEVAKCRLVCFSLFLLDPNPILSCIRETEAAYHI